MSCHAVAWKFFLYEHPMHYDFFCVKNGFEGSSYSSVKYELGDIEQHVLGDNPLKY